MKNTSRKLLTEIHPSSIIDWDYDKNGDKNPEDYTFGSNQKVWWRCQRGHSYYLQINRYHENKCPVCSRESQTSFPEQAILFYLHRYAEAINRWKSDKFEFDIYLPQLSIGIEYDGIYYHKSEKAYERELRKNEYAVTQGITLYRVKESTVNRQENQTLYYLPDSSYSSLSDVIVKLIKMIGISSDDADFDIDVMRDQNEILASYLSILKERSISCMAPHLEKEWLIEKNKCKCEMISIGSKRKFWWKCEHGHQWQAPVYSRIAGNGCPYCSGFKLIQGKNDLLTKNPALAKEWDYQKNNPLTPQNISENNSKKVWWLCSKCEHSWQASVAHRNSGKGCPICGNKHRGTSRVQTIIERDGSLAVLFPSLKNEWDYGRNNGLKPEEVSCKSGKKVWWICSVCGTSWESIIANRTKGAGCPRCAQKKRIDTLRMRAIDEHRSIENSHPSVAAEWDYEKNYPLLPTQVTNGSSKKVWWICPNGHSYCAYISNRCRKGQGCPICRKAQPRKE